MEGKNHYNSEIINGIGTALLIAGIVIGIIGGFIFQVANVSTSTYSSYSRIEYSYNWGLCISLIISSIVVKFFFIALSCIARASEETTMMVYRLICKTSDSETDTFTSKQKIHKEPVSDKPKSVIPTQKTWTCPNCKKVNYYYTTTCTCGEPKPFDGV